MSLYILMTRLTVDCLADPRGRKTAGREWLKHVERVCPEVKFLAHYALLGQFDFMDIYEAPNDEVAHKVSLISRSTGAVTAESWPAVPYHRFLELSGEVEAEIAGHD
jgi:uncharacterized protein with GYD domain